MHDLLGPRFQSLFPLPWLRHLSLRGLQRHRHEKWGAASSNCHAPARRWLCARSFVFVDVLQQIVAFGFQLRQRNSSTFCINFRSSAARRYSRRSVHHVPRDRNPTNRKQHFQSSNRL
uniref:Uncharacterized protein n=1 Tax=Romanomermis culicivorax TaxID=13658 RepID=A0A915JKN5_ROMCU